VGFRVAVRSEARQRAGGQQRAPQLGAEPPASEQEAAPPQAGPPEARLTQAGPASPPQAASRRGPHRPAVGLLTALAAAGYAAFALIRYYTFQSASYDLVIFKF